MPRWHGIVPAVFVLASASPRRRQLLEQLGLTFSVHPADIDESVRPGEAPAAYVARLAAEKAAAVAGAGPGLVVLAADTTVDLEGEIFGKPGDGLEAAAMLRRLSGRTHLVHTGVAVNAEVFVVCSEVRLIELTESAIEWYVSTGEPLDKAGAYAIQGAGGAFVAAINGSFSGVVGLPLVETLAALRRAGVALP